MDKVRIDQLVARITYKPGYSIFVGQTELGPFIQVEFHRPDTFTGDLGVGRSGTARIVSGMTEGDVVRAAFGLLAAVEEHECREAFMVDGVRVFGPHIELGALLEAGRHVQGAVEPAKAPACRQCGARRWLPVSLTGPVEYGGRRLAQCVPCGYIAGDWTKAHDR